MLIRVINNDGQQITTVDMQRNCDIASYADDRALEVLITPGAALKQVMPTSEETASVNPRLLVIPSASNGKVSCRPAYFSAATAAPLITYASNLAATTDIPANIASNSSGSNRYDLIYATITRQVAANVGSPPAGAAYCGIGQASTAGNSTQSRKIKSVVDGAISTQSINLFDLPQVQLSVNQGFLTGGTPPTTSQINAALPADTATSFNFALAYVTVANGFTAGSAIAQSAITQSVQRGWLAPGVARGLWLPDWNNATPNEIPTTSPIVQYPSSIARWGRLRRMFIPLQILTTTSTTTGSPVILDSSIDWSGRIIWGSALYMGAANTIYPLENYASPIAAGQGVAVGATMGPAYTSNNANLNGNISGLQFSYTDLTITTIVRLNLNAGRLGFVRAGGPSNGANGDAVLLMLDVSDKITN